nr:YbdD/YjiX family protein [Stenoxybacter acetivorans]
MTDNGFGKRLLRIWTLLRQTGSLMVGVADYDHYVKWQRRHNANAPVMSQRQFLDYCHNRRSGGKGSRCC